ncbi:hypothetical protein BC939DRAFT_469376 [Gamsiella multidivaricata]|uniref:uncharacterized protein n=1 Tax=Gamsiella multidivaricata TaxID=101098 RepID=UPI00221EA684|nr:uncharacterized protein BC939DRAFT_469376 [Gamsiella multidivaricata]KAI7816342.1 hypothetical protein BC939DRAFT_469376 [Gamsiella multidivaricata]
MSPKTPETLHRSATTAPYMNTHQARMQDQENRKRIRREAHQARMQQQALQKEARRHAHEIRMMIQEGRGVTRTGDYGVSIDFQRAFNELTRPQSSQSGSLNQKQQVPEQEQGKDPSGQPEAQEKVASDSNTQ